MEPTIVFDAEREWPGELLVELTEDLRIMLHQRAAFATSPDATLLTVVRHDRRIAATLDALVLADHQSIPLALEEVALDELHSGMLAALVLALQGTEASREALQNAWSTCGDVARSGLRLGLAALRAEDRALVHARAGDSEHVRAATAFLRVLDGSPPADAEALRWFEHDDPEVRLLVLRLFAAWPPQHRRDSDLARVLSCERFVEATSAPVLVRPALEAAYVWQPEAILDWARSELRTRGIHNAHAAWLLCMARSLSDLPLLLDRRAELGTERYVDVLAHVGHIACGDRLLHIVQQESGVDAALAGRALQRMTGINTERDERIALVPIGGEPDEFTDEVHAVDPLRAAAAWSALRPSLTAASRARGGLDLTLLDGPWPAAIDMQVRSDERTRALRVNPAPERSPEWYPFTIYFARGIDER